MSDNKKSVKKIAKLKLKKETLVRLADAQLGQVVGGLMPTTRPTTCTQGCEE
jgi:hypothetical protein